jgi:hypothetical protein
MEIDMKTLGYIGRGPGTLRRAIGEFTAALFIFVVLPYVMLVMGMAWGLQ